MHHAPRRVIIPLGIALWALAGPLSAQHDILIRGGRVLDGSGNPWRTADVAIDGDRIVAVGDLGDARAQREIDATGLYVSPGFIDVHSHAGSGLSGRSLSHGRPLLAQGIATVIINPDGGGSIDMERQRASLEEHGLGVNVAQLVPHGSVRREVLQMSDRAPTAEELDTMREIVRRGMQAGAFGLSSGLYYAPGSYSETSEVIELAKVVSSFGGVYSSHIRDEADYNVGLIAAVDEVIQIAQEADLPGVVSHVKALGPRVWGFSAAIVARIERARAAGIQVYADQYPYEASGTSINGALVPRWAQVGGRLQDRLADPDQLARLRRDILENFDRRGGAARLSFTRHAADPSVEGRTIQSVAEERGLEAIDLVLAIMGSGGAGLVSFNMNEEDIATLMRQPWTMTSSDGGLTRLGSGVPHPRYYGTFPRKIRKYVVEEQVVGLADAIRSMTSLPASVFNIEARGVVEPRAFADLVIFDLATVRDLATYDDPHQLSEGMVYVLINGEISLDKGRFADELSGRVLRRR